MKNRRGATFLSIKTRHIPMIADSPKKAPRLPLFDPEILKEIYGSMITAKQAADALKKLMASWPYSVENYLKNLERIRKEL